MSLARGLFAEYPDMVHHSNINNASWLHVAAGYGSTEMIQMLLDMGLDVNTADAKTGTTALGNAIGDERIEAARYLLTHGADPNLDRTLIGAINVKSENLALEFVKLLVEHGADVNRVFP